MKQIYRKFAWLLSHHVLHTDDTPHQLALGVAIGMWVTVLPIPGIQMVTTIALAALLRANKAIGVPLAWISNPFTAVPIYGSCLALGRWLLGTEEAELSAGDVFGQLGRPQGLRELLGLEFWKEFLAWSLSVGAELWVGCLIVATLTAVVSYFVFKKLVIAWREKHKHYIASRRTRSLRRELRRARLAKSTEPA